MPTILLNLSDDSRKRVFSVETLSRLETVGELITFDPRTDSLATYHAQLSRADAMLTCWGSRPLTVEDTAAIHAPTFLVAHAAGSVRSFVPKSALSSRVRLTQAASAMAPAVAQYTIGMILMALRQTYYRMLVMKGAIARNPRVAGYRDLEGLTVGLVGLSRVGCATAELLKTFDCQVVAYDPYVTPERANHLGVILTPDLDDLLQRSDVVSLHAPVTDETRNLIDARRIGLLRPGTVLINSARAALVDQDALFQRAETGEIEAYLDVTTPEPLPPDHPAWQCPHIFITPHIAGPTEQTLRRMAECALAEIERFFRGEPLAHEVTVERYDLLA